MHGPHQGQAGWEHHRYRGPVDRHLALRERPAQHFEHMASGLWQLIQKENAVVHRHIPPGMGTYPPPISPTSGMLWWGCDTAGW
jgi:hypothetical protein